jgi:hypothetical protein
MKIFLYLTMVDKLKVFKKGEKKGNGERKKGVRKPKKGICNLEGRILKKF